MKESTTSTIHFSTLRLGFSLRNGSCITTDRSETIYFFLPKRYSNLVKESFNTDGPVKEFGNDPVMGLLLETFSFKTSKCGKQFWKDPKYFFTCCQRNDTLFLGFIHTLKWKCFLIKIPVINLAPEMGQRKFETEDGSFLRQEHSLYLAGCLCTRQRHDNELPIILARIWTLSLYISVYM